MRKLTHKEIETQFGPDKAEQIKTAYVGKHRCQTYSICKLLRGGHRFVLHVNAISDFGYVGMNKRFGLLTHARDYAHAQIDAVLEIDEVSHV